MDRIDWGDVADDLRATHEEDRRAWVRIGDAVSTRGIANRARSGRVRALEGLDVQVEVRAVSPTHPDHGAAWDIYMRINPEQDLRPLI